jgi:hypothetical protein
MQIDQVICDFKTKSRWRKLSRADQKTALADIRAHSDKHSWLVSAFDRNPVELIPTQVTQGRELVLECVEQFEKVSEQIAQDEDFEFDLVRTYRKEGKLVAVNSLARVAMI